jgi:hypothetical protein
LARIRKADSTTPPPNMIGEPKRPGQIEGGNEDPVIVAGETDIKKLNIIRPADIVRAIAYREETNEACFILDEHSAFHHIETDTTPPSLTVDMEYIRNQSKILYFNGNTFVDLDDIVDSYDLTDGTDDVRDYRQYKFNDCAWRPVVQPVPNLDREGIEKLNKDGTKSDFCLLVGEHKQTVSLPGMPGWGSLVMLRPALLGARRDITLDQTDTNSPIQAIRSFNQATAPDMRDVELFGVVWKKRYDGPDSLDGYVLGIAYVVGTEKNGTGFVPKAYKITFNTSADSVPDPHGGDEEFNVYIEDIGIDDIIDDGILFGCEYDDEDDVLYVVGSRFEEGSNAKQIFARYDHRRQVWTDRSASLLEDFNILSEGSDGYLVQDPHGIRLISNSSTFIRDGIKRGQAIWVDITDWSDTAEPDYPPPLSPGGALFANNQSGLFFVQRIASQTELILDKRMPNKEVFVNSEDSGVAVAVLEMSPLFKWGYLSSDITDTDVTVVIDVNTDFSGTEMELVFPAFIQPPAVYDTLTQAVSGASMFIREVIGNTVRGRLLNANLFDLVNNVTSNNGHGVIMNPTPVVPVAANIIDDFPSPTSPAVETVYIEGEQITYTGSSFANVVVDGLPYRRYTLTGCTRGANNTTAIPHTASIQNTDAGGLADSTPLVRTVAVLCEERDFKSFSRLTDVKQSADGASLFITGDNAALIRYDITINKFFDYREKLAVPSTMDFGKESWKPDSSSALIVANTVSNSYVYQLNSNGFLVRISVPTPGIINDVAYTPDGLSAIIGGKYVHKLTRKVNVELAEREPKTIPIRYLFLERSWTQPDFGEVDPDSFLTAVEKSDALAIDDLDPDMLTLFIEASTQVPDDMTDIGQTAPIIEFEVRIYLSARGDEVNMIRRSYWRSITVSDTGYLYNPNQMSFTFVEDPGTVKRFRRLYKLPPWAKYIAVDLINRSAFYLENGDEDTVTIGVQGGVR